ncbi:MAG: hypothetical protein HOQ05_08555 [Corynebacteriales bacterium]|nr:hypothetical protein [Mycobacteriales bacterium]
MRHSTSHRLKQVAATGLALGISGALLGISAPAGAADPTAPQYNAASSASLLRVSALDAHPLGIDLGPLVDLKVSTAGSSVDSTGTPQSQAGSAVLDAAVGKKLPDVPNTSVNQTAAPDNAQPATSEIGPLDLGVAKLGLAQQSANARWNESCEKPTGPTPLTSASTNLATASILPGGKAADAKLPVNLPLGQASSVVEINNLGASASRNDIVEVEGQDNLGVQAQAKISLTDVTLLKGTKNEINIKVISAPTLTATAAGSDKSSVKYTAPILEVTTGGKTKRLDSPKAKLEVPLAATANTMTESTDAKKPALLRLSLADVEKTVTNTSVSAEAASLRLQVLDVPGSGTLLDVGLGLLKAEATVPDGGIDVPGGGKPSENAGGGGGKDLPVTGVGITGILAAGVALAGFGYVAMVMTRRRASATK